MFQWIKNLFINSEPPHVYKHWEHCDWGNEIKFYDYQKRQLVGWLKRIPKKGDKFQDVMQSGKVAEFTITKVERCGDPPDMFWAWFAPEMSYTGETVADVLKSKANPYFNQA